MIKNIIFDLGNVLVGVDFEMSKGLILSAGVSERKYKNFFGKNIKRKYESGNIKTSEFMDLAYRRLGNAIPKKKLKELFEDMFYENPEMKRFLKRLFESGKYRLFLLSNTNPLHFNYIKRKFTYINLIDNFLLSYKLKIVKPDAAIYKTVLKKYKLNSVETIFIDDLEENCKPARKLGIKTICYKNYPLFIKQFRQITRDSV